MEIHPIEPVYDNNSKVLILGSFPSVKSREACFYYAHPQNRFWRMLETIFCVPTLQSVEEKKVLLQQHHIAIWDSIASCDIVGSSDSSIRHVVVNDIQAILNHSDIQTILFNGNTAANVFYRYHKEALPDISLVTLPSTSPANAKYTLPILVETWGKYLK